jgi:hypothetical protein
MEQIKLLWSSWISANNNIYKVPIDRIIRSYDSWLVLKLQYDIIGYII